MVNIINIVPLLLAALVVLSGGLAAPVRGQSPPPQPVRVAAVVEKTVAAQISLIGTTEAIKTSRVASEVEGIVEKFPVNAGDRVQKGDTLAKLRDSGLRFRLKGLLADRRRVAADLKLAERDLVRARELKESKVIPEKTYDEFLFKHQALQQALAKSEAEIEFLRYQIKQKRIVAPFSGFIAEEHCQVGEWVIAGGDVVTLLDLSRIRIEVGVPERYAINLAPGDLVTVVLKNVSADRLPGQIRTILPRGNPTSRNFAVRIELENSESRIKGGMEAEVTFNLPSTQKALLVPKDAIVTAGNNHLVYTVAQGKAVPVGVKVVGYYGGDAAVDGNLKPEMPVVVRGNERLRPGQPVKISE